LNPIQSAETVALVELEEEFDEFGNPIEVLEVTFLEDDLSYAGAALDYSGPLAGPGFRRDNFILVEAIEGEDSEDGIGFQRLGVSNDDIDGINPNTEALLFAGDNDLGVRLVENGSRVIFAAGDLNGLVSFDPVEFEFGDPAASFTLEFTPENVTLDRFAISAGLLRPVAVRSFLPADTWLDLFDGSGGGLGDITTSGLHVVNPVDPMVNVAGLADAEARTVVPGGADSSLFHADFGLANLPGGRQVSSISATIGQVDFRLYSEGQKSGFSLTSLAESGGRTEPERYQNFSVDALLSARTVGTSNNGGGRASTLALSDWKSTAAGGGNPKVPGSGRLGAFTVQNAGPVFDDIASDTPVSLTGGTFRPVGVDPVNAPDQAFGAIRLGIGESGGKTRPSRTTQFSGNLSGYAAGLVEIENGADSRVGLGPFARAGNGPNLTIFAPNSSSTTISGVLNRATGPIAFGGVEGTGENTMIRGAFVDDQTWGMLSTTVGTEMAMISAEPVASELRGQFVTESGATVPIPVKNDANRTVSGVAPGFNDQGYDYLQWGFFFGDAVATDGSREHVHLGSLIAGSPIPQSELDRATGQATYTGHAIGNVYNGGQQYTAVGTFSDRFNFDQKRGETVVDFDRRRLSGSSNLSGGSYAVSINGGDRSGQLNGRFVGGMSGGQPNALAGAFEIQNQATNAAQAYRATGTFGGEK
ncbi:MAG: hypothetical protein AAGF46_07520, partial [Pseudomonadota bacterium]